MNFFPRKFFTLSFISAVAVLSLGVANGQAIKVTGEKPMFDDFKSPEFQSGKSKPSDPRDWLEIETKLKLEMSPMPPSKTCDKITVKWYVAVKNPDKPSSMLLLTKEIDHVNIPLDREVYCSVYLSPASIMRLTGADRGGKNNIEAVGYEVLFNGTKVAEETSKFKAGWWSVASDKISRSETVPLLNKSETPFSAMWWDRYAEISPAKR